MGPGDAVVQALKVPPHSVEAEQSLLGGLLIDNAAWDRLGGVLSDKDFYRPEHALIYKVIQRLVGDNHPADVITVHDAIKSEQGGDLVSVDYLNSLAQNTPSAANIKGYAEIVRDRSILRRLIEVSDNIVNSAFVPEGRSVRTLLDEAETRILEIGEDGSRKADYLEIEPLLRSVVARIDELYNRQGGSDITGIATGFIDLDKQTSGLQKGDLVIVAGRPSMGKAQPLDAKIKTHDGWKLMGELQVGERLASIDGQESVVTGIYPQGLKKIYKVSFSDGRQAECCDEHLWRVMYRDWSEAKVINTSRLMEMLQCVRYKNRLWIDPVSGDFGHSKELPINPWVLGALLGDGTLALSHKSVMFSTNSPELVDRMNALLSHQVELVHAGAYDWRIVSKERIAVNGQRAYVARNYFRDALEDLGVLGGRSFDKFIPAMYLEANRSSRLALLQGLMDTDGWIEKWGSIRFCTVSQQLAKDVASLARSLGAFCSISTKNTAYTYRGDRKQGRLAYVLNMSFQAGLDVFSLTEKKERLRSNWDRQRRLTFTSIEPSRVANAQCISVSHPQRTYVTNDYVLTHNTAFALNIAENVALVEGLPVVVFSMEMSGEQLASRLLGSVGRVDQSRMRTGKLQDDEWPRVTDAIARLSNTQILIDETGSLSSLELRARARRIARNFGGTLGLVVIDYLQLMSGSGQENRATEISEISRSLKSLAKELQCPVVALSQLNRGLEQRPNKRPIMSDLRESGAIEQDADLIMFIYRDEVYHPDTTTDKGMAEIIIGKQRNGQIGTVRLSWQGPYTKFDNLAMGSIAYSSGGYEPF
jgi:replicative DNA helicase